MSEEGNVELSVIQKEPQATTASDHFSDVPLNASTNSALEAEAEPPKGRR